MKVFIGILIFLAVITVITLIRAIFWVPKKRCSLMSIVGI